MMAPDTSASGRRTRAAGADLLSAVVPAAGASRRFGAMKLLADLDGEPLLQHTLRCLLDAGVDRVVAVTAPAHDLRAVSLLADRRVRVAVNPDPDRGMFSSVQVGLSHAGEARAVIVLPADMPFVRAATVAAVLAAHESGGGQATVASHGGRRGHPLVLSAALRAPLRAAPPTTSLKAALDALGVTMHACPVDDPGVLRDVDVRGDLARE